MANDECILEMMVNSWHEKGVEVHYVEGLDSPRRGRRVCGIR